MTAHTSGLTPQNTGVAITRDARLMQLESIIQSGHVHHLSRDSKSPPRRKSYGNEGIADTFSLAQVSCKQAHKEPVGQFKLLSKYFGHSSVGMKCTQDSSRYCLSAKLGNDACKIHEATAHTSGECKC